MWKLVVNKTRPGDDIISEPLRTYKTIGKVCGVLSYFLLATRCLICRSLS